MLAMQTWWFYPLTPAVILLSGAFILGLSTRLLTSSQQQRLGLALVGLFFVNLTSWIAFQRISGFFDAPLVFSSWSDFAILTVRLDGLSMAFLFIPAFLLAAVFWAESEASRTLLLGLGGGAGLVFAAANGLALNYAIVFLDAIGCLFWFRYRHPNLAIARLLLTVLTVSSITIFGLDLFQPQAGALFALVLWLRVGLFPFIEVVALDSNEGQSTDFMVWLAISTAVGVYVAARFLSVPLPTPVLILLVVLTLLNGLLAWYIEARQWQRKLTHLILTQPALALLIAPISAQVSVTMSLVYTLGLAVFWLMPHLGRPNLLERHWLWVYAAPSLATLALIGGPWSLGWVAHQQVYTTLLSRNTWFLMLTVLLAEVLAFSALYQYWQHFLQTPGKRNRRIYIALFLVIPFLVPGIAGLLFEAVTGLTLNINPATTGDGLVNPTGLLIGVWILAVLGGIFQPTLRQRISNYPQHFQQVLSLTWLWPTLHRIGDGMSRVVLRFRSIFEGAHYLSWALLVLLVALLLGVAQ